MIQSLRLLYEFIISFKRRIIPVLILGRLTRSFRVLAEIFFIIIFILIFIWVSLSLLWSSFFDLSLVESLAIRCLGSKSMVRAPTPLMLRNIMHSVMYHERSRSIVHSRCKVGMWRRWRHKRILLLLLYLRSFLVPKENVQSF